MNLALFTSYVRHPFCHLVRVLMMRSWRANLGDGPLNEIDVADALIRSCISFRKRMTGGYLVEYCVPSDVKRWLTEEMQRRSISFDQLVHDLKQALAGRQEARDQFFSNQHMNQRHDQRFQ